MVQELGRPKHAWKVALQRQRRLLSGVRASRPLCFRRRREATHRLRSCRPTRLRWTFSPIWPRRVKILERLALVARQATPSVLWWRLLFGIGAWRPAWELLCNSRELQEARGLSRSGPREPWQ